MADGRTQVCRACQKERPPQDFYKNGRRSDGHDYYVLDCKDCFRAARRARAMDQMHAGKGRHPPEPMVEGQKKCTRCGRIQPVVNFVKKRTGRTPIRAWCKACARDTHMTRNYGLTAEGYAQLLLLQNGVCAICRKPETHHNQHGLIPLSVDHNHATGKVRGLLCHVCNLAIGNMGEDPVRLRAAADYLEKHSH